MNKGEERQSRREAAHSETIYWNKPKSLLESQMVHPTWLRVFLSFLVWGRSGPYDNDRDVLFCPSVSFRRSAQVSLAALCYQRSHEEQAVADRIAVRHARIADTLCRSREN